MITEEKLQVLGLSDKEARVYLALLDLGPSTMTEIARTAGINRTTGYPLLESLAHVGLVTFLTDTKIQKFSAENPERAISLLEEKLRRDQDNLKKAQSLLPELLLIYNLKQRPKVRYYEGVERMREAFEDTLSAKDEILAYAVGTDMFDTMGEDFFKKYFKRRTQKRIHVRVIAPDDSDSRTVVKNDPNELRESILLPHNTFYFSVETNIYNNKLLVISWREKFAVIIESEEIANAQRKIFELAWLGAKQLEKNNLSK